VRADAGWFESGDTQLRLDLQLLNDAEIIRYPLNQWPIPRAGIAYAIANAKDTSRRTRRWRRRSSACARGRPRHHAAVSHSTREFAADSPACGATSIRSAREDAELGAGARYANDRFARGLT
jgi:hypothetical protein